MITSGSGTNRSLLSSCLMHTDEKLPGQWFKIVVGIFFRCRGGVRNYSSVISGSSKRKTAWRLSNENRIRGHLDLDFKNERLSNSLTISSCYIHSQHPTLFLQNNCHNINSSLIICGITRLLPISLISLRAGEGEGFCLFIHHHI